MTVIATDGRTIAADSLMCYGNERAARPANKLLKREGRIFGVAGAGIEEVLITWYLDGADPEKAPKVTGDHWWTLLVIETDGRMLFFTSDAPYGQPAKAPFAIGSGADYALGAMKAGASAKRAVEIACELNVYCGGDIVVLYIDEMQDEAAEHSHANGGALAQ